MSKAGLAERIAMTLARLVAGPERRRWLDAMEAELDQLPAGRLDWALGSLIAAAKDRAAREWDYGLALIGLATAALAAIPLTTLALSLLAELAGVRLAPLSPIVALSSLPFAMALGAVRPWRPVVVSGALGFAAYQAIPAIALPLLFGQYVYVRWEVNLSHYGMLPPSGFVGSLLLWCGGVWSGALCARRRGRPTPPSP